MKTYAIHHTQNQVYQFNSKDDAEIWLDKIQNNNGLGEIIKKEDNKQFLKAYKDKIIKLRVVYGIGGLGFVRA